MLGCILIVAAISQTWVCSTSPCLRFEVLFVKKDVDTDFDPTIWIKKLVIMSLAINHMVLKRIILKLGYQSTSRWCRLQCRRESVCSSLCPIGFVLSENQLLVLFQYHQLNYVNVIYDQKSKFSSSPPPSSLPTLKGTDFYKFYQKPCLI